jgi:hypothetical protein
LCLWILRVRESLDRAVVLLNLHCHLRDANLTLRMRNVVSLLWSEWKDLEQQIIAMNADVEQIVAYQAPECGSLRGAIHLRTRPRLMLSMQC